VFEPHSNGARCLVPSVSGRLCHRHISWSKSGSTTQLWRHLKAAHKPTFIHLKEVLKAGASQSKMATSGGRASRGERDAITDLFVQWVCRRGRPTSIVSDPELQQILSIVSLGRHCPPSMDTLPRADHFRLPGIMHLIASFTWLASCNGPIARHCALV
jgi:hypothetical protein